MIQSNSIAVYAKKGRRRSIFGYVLTILGLFMIYDELTLENTDSVMIVISILLTVWGCYLIRRGIQIKREVRQQASSMSLTTHEALNAIMPPRRTGDMGIDILLQKGAVAIDELHRLCESIENEQVKKAIIDIAITTNGIFKKLARDAETYDKVEHFESYYLAKAMKLLTSYKSVESSKVESKNILDMQEKIVVTLDSLVDIFRKIFDSLYEHSALEVKSAIEELDEMLKLDGLQLDNGPQDLYGEKFDEVL